MFTALLFPWSSKASNTLFAFIFLENNTLTDLPLTLLHVLLTFPPGGEVRCTASIRRNKWKLLSLSILKIHERKFLNMNMKMMFPEFSLLLLEVFYDFQSIGLLPHIYIKKNLHKMWRMPARPTPFREVQTNPKVD